MKKYANIIVSHHILILIIGVLLLIPAMIGFISTKINYDILVYLPEEIDTMKGERILTNDFGVGSYAIVMVDMNDAYKVLKLEEKINKIDGVNKVVSLADLIGTTISKDMLPEEVQDKLYDNDTSIMLVTLKGTTSQDQTIKAVREIRNIVDSPNNVSSMTSLVIDTMDLSQKELLIYVSIAVILCLIVLFFATNSYIIPFLLLSNIGIAILYNMGTNILFDQVSYITKAIASILQLGVTTDFSIFLYHKYIQAKEKYKTKEEAMKNAIVDTFKSVMGSSLTTFVGFLSLCTMELTLGKDIGVVMAKGILFGLLCVITIFPALLLVFDKLIEKTSHRPLFPQFKKLQNFSIKHYLLIFGIFLVMLIPAYIGNKSYDVYYKLDDSLPADLPFHVANSRLAEKFGITSAEIAIIDNDIKPSKVNELVTDLKNIEGIDMVLAPNTLMNKDIVELLPYDAKEILDNPKYQLIIMNSKYDIASDELNKQVIVVEKLLKKYDKKAILAGEGALMKDLVTIADHDFHMVNYTSILVIFLVMLFVLQSVGLPVILIFTIEFAIFLNLGCAWVLGTKLPFIASIVVGTIQLGATIDYAILMSTKYLEERHAKKREKYKAIKDTLKVTVPSIITSALCFCAATIGVSLYSQIDMIASITTLLARGSIISMLVVVIVLPSLLLIFDTFIMKTTKFKKEELK